MLAVRFIAWLAVLLPLALQAANPVSLDLVQRYDRMALAGDLSRAQDLFDELSQGASGRDLALAAAFADRFGTPAADTLPGHGRFSEQVAEIYRAYWRSVLLREPGDPEWRLRAALSQLLEVQGGTAERNTNPLAAVLAALEARKIHHDERPGPPMRDLLLWGEERSARYAVRLSDGTRHVRVRFIDDVLLQGWKDYASLGRFSTTGWAHDGELYCLADAYDLSSEAFRVSFLKHEARHLADLEDFPEMTPTDLEYRAKLTELTFAQKSLESLLSGFSAKAANDPASPHAAANHRVIRDLYRALHGAELPLGFDGWEALNGARINRAAHALLKQDTQARLR
jgi:hypothetical protein